MDSSSKSELDEMLYQRLCQNYKYNQTTSYESSNRASVSTDQLHHSNTLNEYMQLAFTAETPQFTSPQVLFTHKKPPQNPLEPNEPPYRPDLSSFYRSMQTENIENIETSRTGLTNDFSPGLSDISCIKSEDSPMAKKELSFGAGKDNMADVISSLDILTQGMIRLEEKVVNNINVLGSRMVRMESRIQQNRSDMDNLIDFVNTLDAGQQRSQNLEQNQFKQLEARLATLEQGLTTKIKALDQSLKQMDQLQENFYKNNTALNISKQRNDINNLFNQLNTICQEQSVLNEQLAGLSQKQYNQHHGIQEKLQKLESLPTDFDKVSRAFKVFHKEIKHRLKKFEVKITETTPTQPENQVNVQQAFQYLNGKINKLFQTTRTESFNESKQSKTQICRLAQLEDRVSEIERNQLTVGNLKRRLAETQKRLKQLESTKNDEKGVKVRHKRSRSASLDKDASKSPQNALRSHTPGLDTQRLQKKPHRYFRSPHKQNKTERTRIENPALSPISGSYTFSRSVSPLGTAEPTPSAELQHYLRSRGFSIKQNRPVLHNLTQR